MKKEVIYTIPSLYRDDFRITGYRFGSGEKSLCIVGSTRGNEYQQLYTCSQLIKKLKKYEQEGKIKEGKEILVIPAVNPSSINIEKRFWPTDNTDINRMFPGYDLGETTQRIADGLFKEISGYKNGIQLTSFYMPGKFCPHVRIMKNGFENIEKAREFGLPYVVLRIPRPYDTTTLNYNWLIWECDAFSLYSTVTDQIDEKSSEELQRAIVNFMAVNDILDENTEGMSDSITISDREMLNMRTEKSGIFIPEIKVQEKVKKGQLLARVLDSEEGDTIEKIYAPADGIIFFLHDKPLVYANTAAIKLLA